MAALAKLWKQVTGAAGLERLAADVQTLTEGVKQMATALENLTAQVAATKAVEQSAIVLIQGLAEQLAAAKMDPAKVQALSDALKASADQLSAAILNNTPA